MTEDLSKTGDPWQDSGKFALKTQAKIAYVTWKDFCDCETWHKTFNYWKYLDPFDSSQTSIPMYHGKKISYCPYCGKKLNIDLVGYV